jgi:membrane dipeptidase
MRELHRAGIRYVTLTHSNTNNWADSSGPFWLPDFDPKASAKHGGLSEHGRAMVRAMNETGMIVDVSHVSDDTLADVLEVSTAPVMASHSSCRALADMPRNLGDDQIRAIAAKGGVVMINFGSSFLDGEVYAQLVKTRAAVKPEYLALKQRHADDPKALRAALKELFDRQPRPRTQWTRIVDHIDHVIAIGGPDAVGLGSDFDGVEDLPVGMEDVSMLPRLTEELLRRGHSEAQVKKVLGENFLAFFARVEKASAAGRRSASSRP